MLDATFCGQTGGDDRCVMDIDLDCPTDDRSGPLAGRSCCPNAPVQPMNTASRTNSSILRYLKRCVGSQLLFVIATGKWCRGHGPAGVFPFILRGQPEAIRLVHGDITFLKNDT